MIDFSKLLKILTNDEWDLLQQISDKEPVELPFDRVQCLTRYGLLYREVQYSAWYDSEGETDEEDLTNYWSLSSDGRRLLELHRNEIKEKEEREQKAKENEKGELKKDMLSAVLGPAVSLLFSFIAEKVPLVIRALSNFINLFKNAP